MYDHVVTTSGGWVVPRAYAVPLVTESWHEADGGVAKLLTRLPDWGQYSDDTQMTREMCSVIAEYACLAPDAYAGRMLRLYEARALCGAGSTTTGALLRFARGVPWNQLAPEGGRPSNGCAMRVGTLAGACGRRGCCCVRQALTCCVPQQVPSGCSTTTTWSEPAMWLGISPC